MTKDKGEEVMEKKGFFSDIYQKYKADGIYGSASFFLLENRNFKDLFSEQSFFNKYFLWDMSYCRILTVERKRWNAWKGVHI